MSVRTHIMYQLTVYLLADFFGSTVFRHQHWHVRVNSHLEVFILAVEAIPYSKKVGTVDMIALANECH